MISKVTDEQQLLKTNLHGNTMLLFTKPKNFPVVCHD